MNAQEIRNIHARYVETFGSLDEIGLPQLMLTEGFAKFLQAALDRGQAATIEEVRAAFPGEDWEQVED